MSQDTPLQLHFTVAFDDTDCEGIVFFGNYFRMAHRALERYLPLIGIPWADWFKNTEFGVPLRHVEADYSAPLSAGDDFLVKITIKEIGNSSVHFNYEFSTPTGVPVSRLVTSHVFVDRKKRAKTEIPAPIRDRLADAPK